jgi:hypothetical protein
MSTLTLPDIPLESEGPAQRLRRSAAAVRVGIRWWGIHRCLSAAQKEEVSAGYAADARLLTAGKRLIDVRHEAYRKLTGVRTRITNFWKGMTLPYVEPGVRLLKQGDVEVFHHALEGYREELTAAEGGLDAVFAQIKEDARKGLGRLYCEQDYPERVRGLFKVEWDFPSVEPPSYLLRVSPELYEQERRRVAARFEEAVELAERAFAAEFEKLLAHLTERLAGENGEQRVFRDSAVGNLAEFFERFKRLNVRSNPDLDALVEQAQRLVQGVTPQALRADAGLRERVAAGMARVRESVGGLIVAAPRRRVVRPATNGQGGADVAAR